MRIGHARFRRVRNIYKNCAHCAWFCHTTDKMGSPTGADCNHKGISAWWDSDGRPYGEVKSEPVNSLCSEWE